MRLDALIAFDPAGSALLTGFRHIPAERPMARVLGPDAYTALIVPAVEKEHAEQVDGIDRLDVYFEYPGLEHPMDRVGVALAEVGAQPGRIGADHDGVVPYWGYRGPSLGDVTGRPPVDAESLVESLRREKWPRELEMNPRRVATADPRRPCHQSARTDRRNLEVSEPPCQVETVAEPDP